MSQPTYELTPKKCTITNIMQAGACNTEAFHKFCYLIAQAGYGPCEAIPVGVVVECASKCEGGINFLVREGFLHVKKPEPLKVGDMVEIWDGSYSYTVTSSGLSPRCINDDNPMEILAISKDLPTYDEQSCKESGRPLNDLIVKGKGGQIHFIKQEWIKRA